ncbi:MAG: hypothetical protein KAS96_09440 [Planctomycetes bacterium]|nr:hypothetical protein [Planctomycetota bacterium]
MFEDDEYSTLIALPLICAIVFGLATASFLYTSYYAEFLIGSPSSTSCLALMVMPFLVIIGVVAGVVIGIILAFVFLLCGQLTIDGNKLIRLSLIFVIGFSLLTGIAGFLVTKNNVEFNKPRIIYSNESIAKKDVNSEPVVSDTTTVFSEQRDKGRSLVWNDLRIMLRFTEDTICAVDKGHNFVIQTLLDEKFHYIRQLQAMEIRLSPNEKKYLAVIAELRATSHHTMLLIYSPSGSLIYHEMFNNFGREIIIGINKLNSQTEALIIKNKDEIFSYSKR